MMLPVPLDFRAVLQGCMRNGARHAILSQIFNRTAGEVLQPAHQLLKQGNELRQCSCLRPMIILGPTTPASQRACGVAHVPKVAARTTKRSPRKKGELSPRLWTRNSWRRWIKTGGSDRLRGTSLQHRWIPHAISDISSETEATKRRPPLAWTPFPPHAINPF